MTFKYQVDASVPEMAGRGSTEFKAVLKQLGVSAKVIRKISIAMYEGEINMVIHALTNIPTLSAFLPWQTALILIGISIFLSVFAGFIPSRSAAKKDPVVALRTE